MQDKAALGKIINIAEFAEKVVINNSSILKTFCYYNTVLIVKLTNIKYTLLLFYSVHCSTRELRVSMHLWIKSCIVRSD